MWHKYRGKWNIRNGDDHVLVEGDILENKNGEVFMFTDGDLVPLACSYEESLGVPTAETLEHMRVLH